MNSYTCASENIYPLDRKQDQSEYHYASGFIFTKRLWQGQSRTSVRTISKPAQKKERIGDCLTDLENSILVGGFNPVEM